jgi:hypothetical protein
MTTELANIVGHFGGETARTRCFLHVVNLVAKSLLKQFDIPKKVANEGEEDLQAIAQEIDLENEATIAENGDGDPNADHVDNTEGWTDEVGEMTPEEQEALEENIRPIRFVLVKVSTSIKDIAVSSLTKHTSCASSHSKSYIHQLFFYLSGSELWEK